MGSFETREESPDPAERPLRVAMRREELFNEARDMVADLARWTLLESDETALVLRCRRAGGWLGGTAEVTLRVSGPDGIPSATLHVKSESQGGLLARDRAVVLEFLRPFTRRVV